LTVKDAHRLAWQPLYHRRPIETVSCSGLTNYFR